MAKVKVKKQSTFVDMTAMSDVTVLLLTFFMLTATFLPKEPVQVITPQSVSEVKVPDYDVLNILIDTKGRIYLNMDDRKKEAVLKLMGQEYGITFNDRQVRSFITQTHVGVPMSKMSAFLDLPLSDQDAEIKNYGIPADSTNNQLARWVKHAREVGGENMGITIKADRSTPYPLVERVMNVLVDIKENRYSLVTSLRGMPEGF